MTRLEKLLLVAFMLMCTMTVATLITQILPQGSDRTFSVFSLFVAIFDGISFIIVDGRKSTNFTVDKG